MLRKIALITAGCILIAVVPGYYFLTADQLKNTSFDNFNLKVKESYLKKEIWTQSAVDVAKKYANESEYQREEANVKENGDIAEVTLIYKGFSDDSVEGSKYVIKLKKESNGCWKIINAQRGFRCWKGRGHQNYSNEPCT